MKEKEPDRCPECNKKRIAIMYGVDFLEIRCQNGVGMYPRECNSIGNYAFLIDKKTMKVVGKVDW